MDTKIPLYIRIHLTNNLMLHKYEDPIERELIMKTILHAYHKEVDIRRVNELNAISYIDNFNPSIYTSYEYFMREYINNRVKQLGITFPEFIGKTIVEMNAMVDGCKKMNAITNNILGSIGGNDATALEELENEFQ